MAKPFGEDVTSSCVGQCHVLSDMLDECLVLGGGTDLTHTTYSSLVEVWLPLQHPRALLSYFECFALKADGTGSWRGKSLCLFL